MAWKKPDDPPTHHYPDASSATPQRPSAAPAPAAAASEPPRRTERATIGPSIFIKGDLSGEEDLVIEGRVEGKVDLKQNNVTVGKNGRVRADIFGRVVTIEGEVDGNVFAREQASTREMAVLHLVDGLTLDEVAKEVGLSVSGVRKRLRVLKEHVAGLELA